MAIQRTLTTCPYCGTGCNFYLKVRNNKVIGIVPYEKGAGMGKLCIKGWNAHEFIHHPDRLKTPLIRDRSSDEFREANWAEALDLIASKLHEIRTKYGYDALGFLSSAKCLNEENYVLQKFARAVFKTNNVDHCARLCHASTVVGLVAAFGSGAMTNSIAEIEDADMIFVIGSNTTEQHPLIGRRILTAIREKSANLIVADPREIDLAKLATIYMPHKSGTDVALLNSMMHVILTENLHKFEFITQHTENFEEFQKEVLRDVNAPRNAEKITGVPAERIRQAARLYARAKAATILYSMGITQHTTGVDNVMSIANLAMLCHHIGRPNTGVNPLRGQNNVQGACDMGALSNVFPGYQAVTVTENRKKMEEVWGVTGLPDNVGLTVVEMINAAYEGNIKGMFIMGENPMVTDPDVNHVKKALENLEFLVVSDIFLSETAQLANVVLPACSYAEKDGTYTNTERRVLRVRKAIEPLGDSKPDWWIIGELTKRLGYDGLTYASTKEIMDEIAQVTPIYNGISFDRLEEEGLQWPCPNQDHPGTPYLHKDGNFSRGKGRFHPIKFKPPAETPNEEYPFILTTGRILFQWHSGTMTRRSPSLETQAPAAYIEINTQDASRLGIKSERMVGVTTRRGKIQLRARVTVHIRPGTVFIPFHFTEAAANVLTNPALDPKAKIPEYKACACRIDPV